MGTHLFTGSWETPFWDYNYIRNYDQNYDADNWHIYGWEWTDEYAKWWIKN